MLVPETARAAPAIAGSDPRIEERFGRRLGAEAANRLRLQFAPQAVCCDLIRDDIACNIGAMAATLNAALAMHGAEDDIGLLYSLRRARAYWLAIAASARDLAALKQEGGR
jgi:hypothetical protein